MALKDADWARTIRIPTGKIKTTQFDLTDEEKDWLYQSGYAAADKFGVTRSRIRQIEIKTKGKLAFRPKNGIELLPTMTRKALLEAGIKTIEEAKGKTDHELRKIKNIGMKGLKAIRNCSKCKP